MISAVMPTYNRADLSFVKGEGCWLIEADGRRFLDMTAGIAVNALGHAHPALVTALQKQSESLWHISNLYRIPEQEKLAKMLTELTFCDTVFFTNSGTEACELAIKMARKKDPARHRILTFEGAFHGRSIAAISAVGSEKLTAGFAPLLPGFTQIPWLDMAALEAECGPDVAAILVEPVQGEGGIRPMPAENLRFLRSLCDAHGILLILDEVQCGVGRSGTIFAHEQAGIAPDIMMIAKGIGGGFPLGAVLATESAAAAMTPGTHGSTYGGNPLACAVGAALLEIVSAPDFLASVREKGARLRHGLQQLLQKHPDVFTEIRGQGLMLGLQTVPPCADLVAAAQAQELLLVPAADNVVRILPPLTINDNEIDTALLRLDKAAATLAQSSQKEKA